MSTVADPTEVFVENIAEWCEEQGIDKSMPTTLNNPESHLYQKQTGGWRVRRADMPLLPQYEDKRHVGHPNVACRGRSWKLVNGKRVWCDK